MPQDSALEPIQAEARQWLESAKADEVRSSPPRVISGRCCSCSKACCGGCVVVSCATTTTSATRCRAASSRDWAAGVAPATPIVRGVSAATRRRRASTVAPISIPSISIAIPVTVATIATTTVTIPTRRVVRVSMITWIPGGATMPHVFTRGRRMWAVSHGVVNTDTTAIEVLLRNKVNKVDDWLLKILRHTTPFNSWMQRVASSTVAILMKPNPRERSDC